MTTATIRPDDFPARLPVFSYNGWIVDLLRKQGIRFSPELPFLVTPDINVQAHIAPPWRMERSHDGVVTVWQGDE